MGQKFFCVAQHTAVIAHCRSQQIYVQGLLLAPQNTVGNEHIDEIDLRLL